MKPVIVGSMCILAAGLGTVGCDVRPRTPPVPPQATTPARNPFVTPIKFKLTRENYDAVRTGMTLEEVQAALGEKRVPAPRPPTRKSDPDAPISTMLYSDKNEDGTEVTWIFLYQEDRLVSKSASGMK